MTLLLAESFTGADAYEYPLWYPQKPEGLKIKNNKKYHTSLQLLHGLAKKGRLMEIPFLTKQWKSTVQLVTA